MCKAVELRWGNCFFYGWHEKQKILQRVGRKG